MFRKCMKSNMQWTKSDVVACVCVCWGGVSKIKVAQKVLKHILGLEFLKSDDILRIGLFLLGAYRQPTNRTATIVIRRVFPLLKRRAQKPIDFMNHQLPHSIETLTTACLFAGNPSSFGCCLTWEPRSNEFMHHVNVSDPCCCLCVHYQVVLFGWGCQMANTSAKNTSCLLSLNPPP